MTDSVSATPAQVSLVIVQCSNDMLHQVAREQER